MLGFDMLVQIQSIKNSEKGLEGHSLSPTLKHSASCTTLKYQCASRWLVSETWERFSHNIIFLNLQLASFVYVVCLLAEADTMFVAVKCTSATMLQC